MSCFAPTALFIIITHRITTAADRYAALAVACILPAATRLARRSLGLPDDVYDSYI